MQFIQRVLRTVGRIGCAACVAAVIVACRPAPGAPDAPSVGMPGSSAPPAALQTPGSHISAAATANPSPTNKWELWLNGPHLRGANIYRWRVYPELVGEDFMGPGPTGPPYTLDDFKRLAALGANYVNISQPGLFTEKPPFALDPDMQAALDQSLELARQADLFAVISARSGPGRSEFSFYFGRPHSWFDDSYYNDTIWTDPAAQEAWAAMWRYTAERYRDNPIVVGYDLMVEPNCNSVCFSEWEEDRFFPRVRGTRYDWSALAARVTAAIRQVDPETPILVGGEGYSRVDWLPYLLPTGDPRTVYTAHQYDIYQYTHQRPGPDGALPLTYPGLTGRNSLLGQPEKFDPAWLDRLMGYIDDYQRQNGAPLAINEFGVMRWQPGAAEFLKDELAAFEAHGLNNALWVWYPAWPGQQENDPWQFLHGPDPETHAETPNALFDVIIEYWRLNRLRPSTWRSLVPD